MGLLDFVEDKVKGAADAVTGAATAVVQKVEQTAQAVEQKVEQTAAAVEQKVETTVQQVEQKAQQAVKAVKKKAAAVVQTVENTAAAVEDDAKKAVRTVEDDAKKVGQTIEDDAKKVADAAAGAVKAVVDEAKKVEEAAVKFVHSITGPITNILAPAAAGGDGGNPAAANFLWFFGDKEVEFDVPDVLSKQLNAEEEPVIPEGNIVDFAISIGLEEVKIKWKGKGDGKDLKEGTGASAALKKFLLEKAVEAWKGRTGGMEKLPHAFKQDPKELINKIKEQLKEKVKGSTEDASFKIEIETDTGGKIIIEGTLLRLHEKKDNQEHFGLGGPKASLSSESPFQLTVNNAFGGTITISGKGVFEVAATPDWVGIARAVGKELGVDIISGAGEVVFIALPVIVGLAVVGLLVYRAIKIKKADEMFARIDDVLAKTKQTYADNWIATWQQNVEGPTPQIRDPGDSLYDDAREQAKKDAKQTYDKIINQLTEDLVHGLPAPAAEAALRSKMKEIDPTGQKLRDAIEKKADPRARNEVIKFFYEAADWGTQATPQKISVFEKLFPGGQSDGAADVENRRAYWGFKIGAGPLVMITPQGEPPWDMEGKHTSPARAEFIAQNFNNYDLLGTGTLPLGRGMPEGDQPPWDPFGRKVSTSRLDVSKAEIKAHEPGGVQLSWNVVEDIDSAELTWDHPSPAFDWPDHKKKVERSGSLNVFPDAEHNEFNLKLFKGGKQLPNSLNANVHVIGGTLTL